MIYEVSGDILLTKAQAIAHGISPNDHFNHGLALALREKWPMMASDFRHFANQSHPKPGEIWAWGGFNTRIYCLMTQEGEVSHGGRPGKAATSYVNHCLQHLSRRLKEDEVTSLAIPRLATGVGGLEWKDVLPLIQHHLGALSIPTFIYTRYERGVQAVEQGL